MEDWIMTLERKYRPLYACGQADADNVFQRIAVNAQLAETQLAVSLAAAEHPEHRHGGNRLRNGSADRNARHAHVEGDDEQKVYADVYKPRKT